MKSTIKDKDMELKLVSLELAKKLKEVGCDLEECRCGGYPDCICTDKRITLSLAKMWFREEYNIYIQVEVDCTMEPKFVFTILKYDDFEWIPRNPYYSDLDYTFEAALEAALMEACNLITKMEE